METLRTIFSIENKELTSFIYKDNKTATTAIVTEFLVDTIQKNPFNRVCVVLKKSYHLKIIYTNNSITYLLDIPLIPFTVGYGNAYVNIKDYLDRLINLVEICQTRVDYAFDHKIHRL